MFQRALEACRISEENGVRDGDGFHEPAFGEQVPDDVREVQEVVFGRQPNDLVDIPKIVAPRSRRSDATKRVGRIFPRLR